MTRLGTLIFSAIGLLCLGFVIFMIRLALRSGGGGSRGELEQAGWTIADAQAPALWTAHRTVDGSPVTLTVTRTGVRTQMTRTTLSVPADGTGELLLTKKGPGFMSADGLIADVVGFTPPPRWAGGAPAFASVDAFASDDATAQRWLTVSKQEAIAGELSRNQLVLGVSFSKGRWTAQLSGEIADPAVVDSVARLLVTLRK